MGKHIHLQCNCCEKKSESEILPEGWTWITDFNHDTKDVCFCSVHCMMLGIAADPSILSNTQYLLSTDFLLEGAKIYKEFHDSAKALEEKYANTKRISTDSIPLNGKSSQKVKPGKGSDVQMRRYTKEEKAILKKHPTFEEAYKALLAENPKTEYVRGRVYASWYAQHNSKKDAPVISKEDKKEFDVAKSSPKPVANTETEKAPEIKQVVTGGKSKVKNYLYYSDDQLPWLEKTLAEPFVKTPDCMQAMKDEWAAQKHTPVVNSTMHTSRHEVPDAAFLRFEGYYSIWLSEPAFATISSAIHSNGIIDNLQEAE